MCTYMCASVCERVHVCESTHTCKRIQCWGWNPGPHRCWTSTSPLPRPPLIWHRVSLSSPGELQTHSVAQARPLPFPGSFPALLWVQAFTSHRLKGALPFSRPVAGKVKPLWSQADLPFTGEQLCLTENLTVKKVRRNSGYDWPSGWRRPLCALGIRAAGRPSVFKGPAASRCVCLKTGKHAAGLERLGEKNEPQAFQTLFPSFHF